jgi:hypothetical protein
VRTSKDPETEFLRTSNAVSGPPPDAEGIRIALDAGSTRALSASVDPCASASVDRSVPAEPHEPAAEPAPPLTTGDDGINVCGDGILPCALVPLPALPPLRSRVSVAADVAVRVASAHGSKVDGQDAAYCRPK